MQNVYESLIQVFSTAELCAERGVVLLALILAYSTMDSMGWMAAPDVKTPVRQRFVSWVDRYALPAEPALQCTALELYAARCGVLHTFTADSDLSDRGTRKIVYAWGAAETTALASATDKAGNDRWVAVHVRDLVSAVRLGTAQMFEDSQSDRELAARMEARGAGFFESLEANALDFFKQSAPAV